MLKIRKFEEKDLPEMVEIWNHVVKEGNAFPQEEYLNEETGKEFFPRRASRRLPKMKRRAG